MNMTAKQFQRAARDRAKKEGDPANAAYWRLFAQIVPAIIEASKEEDARGELHRGEIVVVVSKAVGASLMMSVMSAGPVGGHMEVAAMLTPIVSASMADAAEWWERSEGGNA